MAFEPFTENDRPTMAAFNSKLEALYEGIAAGPKIEFGSYVGTGTYGSANKIVLSFSFATDIVVFYASKKSDGTFDQGIGGSVYSSYGFSILSSEMNGGRLSSPAVYIDVSDDGKTYSFYASSAAEQNNSTGVTYYYFAMSKGGEN